MYEDRNAVYAIHSYVWKLLEANLGWDLDDWGGARPIIPAAQQPEFMAIGKPFLVYGSAIHQATHLYPLVTEAITYNVYATSATEVNKIANLLAQTFDRQDEAAADINDWIDLEGQEGNRPSGHRKISFGSVRTIMVEKAEPADEEGGFYSAIVMFEAKYVVHNDTLVTTNFVYP